MMKNRIGAASQVVHRLAIRHAWTTRQQKWVTAGVILGIIIGSGIVPSFGLAAFGTAIAGWWLAVVMIALFGGFMGHYLNLRSELAKLKRRVKNQQ